jgi:hypothetical protein
MALIVAASALLREDAGQGAAVQREAVCGIAAVGSDGWSKEPRTVELEA